MKPGVMHSVLTVGSTIATGEHLYSWMTGIRTCIALIEQSFYSRWLNNTFHRSLEIVRIQMLQVLYRTMVTNSESPFPQLDNIYSNHATRGLARPVATADRP